MSITARLGGLWWRGEFYRAGEELSGTSTDADSELVIDATEQMRRVIGLTGCRDVPGLPEAACHLIQATDLPPGQLADLSEWLRRHGTPHEPRSLSVPDQTPDQTECSADLRWDVPASAGNTLPGEACQIAQDHSLEPQIRLQAMSLLLRMNESNRRRDSQQQSKRVDHMHNIVVESVRPGLAAWMARLKAEIAAEACVAGAADGEALEKTV